MDNPHNSKEENCHIHQLNGSNEDNWLSREEPENASNLHYIAIKMENTSGNTTESKDQGHLEQISASNVENWPNTIESGNNSTLLYIAVEYIKNNTQSEEVPPSNQAISQETYTDFVTPHVSPLDPNMSSVARYSPVSVQYQENCNSELAPIIIHQYVTQDTPVEQQGFVNHITAESSLEDLSSEMPMVLSKSDLQTEQHQYMEMMENGDVNICENDGMQLISENDQQEVELLITDHATGISYSVNAQELLVERCLEDDHQLLEAIAPNPILESDLFALDDGTLRSELNNELTNSTVVTSVNEEVIKNYIDCLTNKNTNCTSEGKVHTRRNCVSNVEEEERLLSCVYSITDKPILSRARASLPESHLSIVKFNEEEAVVAKKRIPKRTQFGPLKGVLNNAECKKDGPNSNNLWILVEGNVYSVDVFDENNCNWMSFVRKALTYEEQNLIVTQEGNELFFTTTRNIIPKEELKVGYSTGYAQQFGLEVLKPIEKRTWPCYECSDKFCSSEDLQKHFSVHDQERDENTKPKRKYRKPTNFARSSKLQVDVVECNMCHDLFNANVSYTILKNHLAEKHNLSGFKSADHFSLHQCFQCLVCSMRFKLEILLKIHKLEHDPELPLDQPNHVCPQCQRKFPTRKQLVLHVPTHSLSKTITKVDSVKCPICHKSFSHSVRLQKHMLCHGSEESKPLQCKTCKKRFLTTSALSFHMKIHIVGEKHFECPICKERFDHVLKLRLHIPKHAHNNMYTCPHCKKVFGKYSIIRKHIKFHSEKKHHCTQCTKSFPTPENLKKHMLRHSDHREFLCADCGKQFKRKDKLADHIKKLHLQPRSAAGATTVRISKPKPPSATPPATVKEPTDFHRFIYKCHSCLVGFKRRGMLVNHLVKRHPDIRPDSVPELNLPILQTTRDYYCQYCDKVYKSSSKRKIHILKNHPGAALPVNHGQKTNPQTGVPNSSFSTAGSVTTRPKNCQWCHRQYARKNKLLQHIRKAHPSKILEDEPETKDCDKDVTDVPVATAALTTINNKIPEETKPFIPSPKDVETDFILNQAQKYQEVLQKNQTTTDGNMTDIITPAVIDGLMDEDSKYCHLSIDENEIIENGELENHNVNLYHLLTSSNGLIPPH